MCIFCLKANTKEKYEEKTCKRFLFQNLKLGLFQWSTNFFLSSFFPVLALKTRDAQMLFRSVFLKTQKKVINCQKRPKWHFWWSINFLVHFQKYWTKEQNQNQSLNTKKNCFRGFFFKNQKLTFLGVQNSGF